MALPFASSYIPTTDSTVTRGADVCECTVDNNITIIDGYESSLIFNVSKIGLYSTAVNPVALSFDDAVIWVPEHSTGKCSFMYGAHTPFGDTLVADEIRSYAHSCDGTTATYYQNGVSKATTTNLTSFTSLPTKFSIGSNKNGIAQLFGHINNVKWYDKALSPTEVNLLGGTN